jgi:hypothetical protein
VPEEKPPVEKAVELFVYAPVGMALYVRDMLPSMMGIFVSRGKREVQAHRSPPPPPVPPVPPVPPEVKRRIDESVGMARVVAEGGFGVAREVAGSGIGVARDVAGSALAQFLALRANGASLTESAPPSPAAPPAPEATPEAPTAAPVAPSSAPAAPTVSDPPVPPDAAWKADVAAADALPIPDYDELSASQVVERLDGLDRESLDAIRRYETAHRGRNTILGKIAQLS